MPSSRPMEVFASESHLKPSTCSARWLSVYGPSTHTRVHDAGPTNARLIGAVLLALSCDSIALLISLAPNEHAPKKIGTTTGIAKRVMGHNAEASGRRRRSVGLTCCMKPPWPRPDQQARLDADAAREAHAGAARVPRDRRRLPKSWQADDHEGNFASTAWPRQLLERKRRQLGIANLPPRHGDERKPSN